MGAGTSTSPGVGRCRNEAAATLLATLALILALNPASAGAGSSVTINARIDDRAMSSATETRPILLSPRRPATLSVDLTNHGPDPVNVRVVRLEGRVVGLTFFAYDTAVGLNVPPGARGSRRFVIDLGGLAGQATGLIPGAVTLLDAERDVVAEQRGVIDVRGSLRSV